ncbi:MAG: FCD domain-containing protein [Deltaproteobacteria bacterium]|nr:FCD domain-containing protein [Deltaproteobacteria bacterium]
MLKPIKKESVRGQVFLQLRDQILRRTWPPGSKLPSEQELSRTMGVSRVSIREGIQHLVSLGILETRHGEGTYVRELEGGQLHFSALIPLLVLDDIDILQVLEYRRIVEKGAAALAAERATAQDMAEMESVYEQMVQSCHSVAEFAHADLEFHLVLAKATGNPVIIKVNNVLRTILEISMDNIVSTLKMVDGLHYHRLLIDAIAAHDPEAAESIMQEHVDRTIVRLKAEGGLAARGTIRTPEVPERASLVERLDLHRAFWAREKQSRPLAAFRVGDFFFARHFQAALTLLEPDNPVLPEMLNVAEFLPDYERMFRETEELGPDAFWTGEPYTGIPWMEAILGCSIRAGRDSMTSKPWLSSTTEALDKVRFDPQNPWLAKYLEFTTALVKQSRGRYPVGMPIMRGPTDILGALLGQQEMVMALVDSDPQETKRLIERVTLAFLAVIEAQRRLIPPFYGGQALGFYHIWAPGKAIWFQDDLSAILSPGLYRQFFLDSARLILAGQEYTAVHLHPNSFFILDDLLSLENLKVVQVNKDIHGPGIAEMLPVLMKIMQTHGLILWGDLTVEDLELVRKNLPCRGLALNVVAPTKEEAAARLAYIRHWE